jgi:hypothetical protein
LSAPLHAVLPLTLADCVPLFVWVELSAWLTVPLELTPVELPEYVVPTWPELVCPLVRLTGKFVEPSCDTVEPSVLPVDVNCGPVELEELPPCALVP